MSVADELEASLFLEALLVALVGAARSEPLPPMLRDQLADFGLHFGAAFRLEPALLQPFQHAKLRRIAERAIYEARLVMNGGLE